MRLPKTDHETRLANSFEVKAIFHGIIITSRFDYAASKFVLYAEARRPILFACDQVAHGINHSEWPRMSVKGRSSFAVS